jgi:hypothetical protein
MATKKPAKKLKKGKKLSHTKPLTEQVLNIGSQTGGAGGGKATFDPF